MSTLLFQPHPILSETPPRYEGANRCPFICEREAGTLAGLLVTRVLRSPDCVAYRWFTGHNAGSHWQALTWSEVARRAGHWQRVLLSEGLKAGDRIAIMLPNGPDWVSLDLAALGLGMIIVPLFVNDRAANAAYCLEQSEARLLVLCDAARWHEIVAEQPLPALKRVVTTTASMAPDPDARVMDLETWLASAAPVEEESYEVREKDPDAVATICYTSGTTGHPKGVTLTHRNILWDAEAGLRAVHADEDDRFLSFLPLSHMLERTAGYYIPMMCGAQVSFARGISELAEDMRHERPTVLISVPRIFERVEDKVLENLAEGSAIKRALFKGAVALGWERFQQRMGRAIWCPRQLLAGPMIRLVGEKLRAAFGGHLRFAIVGGAALSPHTARLFTSLGVHLLQGYGLTETSPIISVNRLQDDDPSSVGAPLAGVELRIGEHQEILVRSPGVMRGYWKQPGATEAVIDAEGWLHTGDQGELRDGKLHITGRLKDILVMSTGEKVPAIDMEAAIARDGWFEQLIVIGDGRPCLAALVVLSAEAGHPDEAAVVARMNANLGRFPAYARIAVAVISPEAWTVDNELLTPTMKVRRHRVLECFAPQLDALRCRR